MNERITTNDKCVGCNRCIMSCPCWEANVSKMEEDGRNHIFVNADRCITCGMCVRSCIHGARDYHDDTERFFADLRAGREISVIAAPAIRSNFEDYRAVLAALKRLGVRFAFDTSLGADICTWAYLRHIEKTGKMGLISQPCPAIVNYIERYAVDLLPMLAPIHSPAMCTAVYMRKYKNIGGAYAFLSPCIAKRDEFGDENTGGLVSYNVTFQKLAAYMEENRIRLTGQGSDFDNERHGLGAVFPMPGGLRVNVEAHVPDAWVYQVEGQPHACHFLETYGETLRGGESLRLGDLPVLVDILNCPHGCNQGTGALCGEAEDMRISRTMHRAKLETMTDARGKVRHRKTAPGPAFRRLDRELTLQDFTRAYTARALRRAKPTAREMEAAFLSLRKMTDDQRHIDCRSCGYPGCQRMAEAVCLGINHPQNCVEYHKSLMREQTERTQELAAERERLASDLREHVSQILDAINEAADMTTSTVTDLTSINARIETMNDITKQLNELVSTMEAEMGKYETMVGTIVGISSQTNLLALNASVEAAHAGQFGKGFAVVAEEMKTLSDMSRRSAEESLKNNEVILPLLKRVFDMSLNAQSETRVISDNAANILSAVNRLSETQMRISESAQRMSRG